MDKRFKDDISEHHHRDSDRIVRIIPETGAAPDDPGHPGRNPHHQGPDPVTLYQTVEDQSEIDRLNAQVQELKAQTEGKDREIAELKKRGGDGAPTDASGPSDSDAKDQEIAELKDKYLRALAEGENTRRRIRQQSDDSVRIQRENLLRDLLPIVDNLERALSAAKGTANGKSIIEGVEMVLASLMDFLKSNGVRAFSDAGQPFDPNRHEAVDHVHSDTHPPNTVIQDANRGYVIGDRILRPARVVVSKDDRNSGSA